MTIQRMHPEDLRALMAAVIYASPQCASEPQAANWTDSLLAQLARTAKPETDAQAALASYTEWEREILAAARASGWSEVEHGGIQGWIKRLGKAAKESRSEAIRNRERAEAAERNARDIVEECNEAHRRADKAEAERSAAGKVAFQFQEAAKDLCQKLEKAEARVAELEQYKEGFEQILHELRAKEAVLEAYAVELREALQDTHDALKEPAFIRCRRCGGQESTEDMDVMSLYIKPALARSPIQSLEDFERRVLGEAVARVFQIASLPQIHDMHIREAILGKYAEPKS